MRIIKYFEFKNESKIAEQIWKSDIQTIIKLMFDNKEISESIYKYSIKLLDTNFSNVLEKYGKMSASMASKKIISDVGDIKYEKVSKYLKEGDNFQDTPEEYIKVALMKIKTKIESMFDTSEDVPDDKDQIVTMSSAKKKGDIKKGDESKMSFKDMNLNLDSCEMSKYSAIFDSVKAIFSDNDHRYDLYITIPLESGISQDKTKDFSSTDIKDCSIKFKKYDTMNFDLIGQIGPKKIDISDINEEFLVNLKIELDDEFGGEDEKLEFET